MAWCSMDRESRLGKVWSLEGGGRGARRSSAAGWRKVRAGCHVELHESDGWLEVFEEVHNEKALDDLDEGRGVNSWLTFCGPGPDGGSGVVEDAGGPHLAPRSEGVLSVGCLVEALDESVTPCAWAGFCTCFG